MKSRRKLFFNFQTKKLCCEVFRINNFQRQSCSCTCLEDSCVKIGQMVENRSIFTHSTMIPVHPSPRAFCNVLRICERTAREIEITTMDSYSSPAYQVVLTRFFSFFVFCFFYIFTFSTTFLTFLSSFEQKN